VNKTAPYVIWHEVDDEVYGLVWVAEYRHPLGLPRLQVSAWFRYRQEEDSYCGELEFDHDLPDDISQGTLMPSYSFSWFYADTARAYIEARILLAAEFVTLWGTGQDLREYELISDPPPAEEDEPEPEPDPTNWSLMIRDLLIGIILMAAAIWAYGLFLA
jgi:hypothetical protein